MAKTEKVCASRHDITGSKRLRAIELVVASIAGGLVLLAAAIVQNTVATFWLTVAIAVVAWLLVAHAGAFKVAISMEDWQVVPTVAVASLVGFVSTAAGELLFRWTVHSAVQYLISSLVAFAALTAGVLLARQFIRVLWQKGFFRTTAIVVGNEFTTHELVIEMRDHQQLGIDVVAKSDIAMDGSLARLVADTRPDRVIIAGETTRGDFEIAATLADSSARVYVMPQLFVAKTGSAWFAPHQVNGFPLIRVDNNAQPSDELTVAPSRDLVREI